MAQRRMSFRRLFSGKKVAPDKQLGAERPNDAAEVKEKSELLQKQGCIWAEKGTPEDFKEAIKKFSEIKSPTVDVLYLRGNAHLKLGSPKHNQKAVDDFTEAIRRSNEEPPSLHLIANLYYKRAFAHQMLGENEHALRDYSLFIRFAKDEEADVLAKGFLSRGLVYESMRIMQKALADIDTAIRLTHEQNPYYKYCRERVCIAISETNDDEDDENAEIDHFVRKYQNDKENDDDEELKIIEKQMSSQEKLDSEIPSETPNPKYERLFYDALLHSEQGKSTEALEKFKNAFKYATNESEKADNLFRQGLCHYELGEKTQAENMFREALGCNPKHPRATFRLGMMQAANNQLKDALRTLSLAYKYAPNHVDILHERANIYEKLGKLDEAMYDRRRAMQLVQSPSYTIVILEDRMRHLKAEILQKGESAARHFKIGWLQQALHKLCSSVASFREEKGTIIKENEPDDSKYKEAVSEYRAAIFSDAEHLCPEAHALLALCQDEHGKDILPAHDAFRRLFEMFESFPDSIIMWKSFVKKIRETNFWKEMGGPPSETILTKVQEIEYNRKEINDDEKSFNANENLLLFYHTCRIQLSNVLAAFALGGCPQEIIAHNMKGSYSKAATILSLIAKGVSNVPQIGVVLQFAGDQTAAYLEDKDHELIKNKLEVVSNCGDIIDQCEVARRVARRLADRYKEQLIRLHHKNEEINTGCCSCCKKMLPYIEPLDEREPAKRVALFAVNYIISAVTDQSIKTLRLQKASNKDSLVEMLVELACRARGPKIDVPKCYHDNPNHYLPLTPKPNTNSTMQQPVPIISNQDTTVTMNITTTAFHSEPTSKLGLPVTERFTLYDFFRAPGLRYDPREDLKATLEHQQQRKTLPSVDEVENQQNPEELINHNDKDQIQSNQHLTSTFDQNTTENQDPRDGEEWAGFPYMHAEHNGYRLCSRIELESLKQELQNMKQRCVCCSKCCC